MISLRSDPSQPLQQERSQIFPNGAQGSPLGEGGGGSAMKDGNSQGQTSTQECHGRVDCHSSITTSSSVAGTQVRKNWVDVTGQMVGESRSTP